MNFNEYRESLRLSSMTEPGFWFGKCANWYECGSTQNEFIVADEYYDSYEQASAAGDEYGMRICRGCRNTVYAGWQILLMRNRVSLKRRRPCETTEEDCTRVGAHFFINAGGNRTWMCANHVAVHSVSTDTYYIARNGQWVNSTEDMYMFYLDNVYHAVI